jgi:transposase
MAHCTDLDYERFYSSLVRERALYDRLRANGKTGKQALVAVMNKLLKQVFAVVKSNSLYQPNYCSAKP